MHKLVLFFLLLVVAVLVFTEAVFKVEPIAFGGYLTAQFGAVTGMSAEVPENPFNTLASQLAQKEAELDARERAIETKEETITTRENKGNSTLFYLSVAFTVLLILILFNFYLDYRRRR